MVALSLSSSLLHIQAFVNNFQEAKNALAEVTAQAAEKAASGVLELAERSTRISLDVDIKAPVVFLPQSSVSHNVIVADLGLVTVKNHFKIVSSPTHNKIPPVVDIMAVGLSDLKMYRLEDYLSCLFVFLKHMVCFFYIYLVLLILLFIAFFSGPHSLMENLRVRFNCSNPLIWTFQSNAIYPPPGIIASLTYRSMHILNQ